VVTLNFILVNGPEGWLITDVESPHDFTADVSGSVQELRRCILAIWCRAFAYTVIARSEATKQSRVACAALDCFASLAMTTSDSRCDHQYA